MNPASVRRLAIIRPRFLGDVCLTLPMLDAARAACPGARVAYVVERASAPLLAGDPRIDELIEVPARPGAKETLALVRRLRAFAPEVAIDCFCNPRTAVWTRLSGARVRVGGANKGWRSAMYTHHPRQRTASATAFHVANLAALGWPEPERTPTPRLYVTPSQRDEALGALARLGAPADAMLVGFHPGARWPTRRWDPQRYAQLAGRLLAAHENAIALFTAGPGEEAIASECVAGLPAGRAFAIEHWPLARFVGLQSACAAFVCGDTGPLHTSVAAGTRTLGMMSRNHPSSFFPYPEHEGHRTCYARAECSPCNRDVCADLRCLHRLTVDMAWAALRGMLPQD